MPSAPTFEALPNAIEGMLTSGNTRLAGLPTTADRVLLLLVDAFGRHFLNRTNHPLLQTFDVVVDLQSMFPSTTTAHITTLHTGLPVGQHGLYEWDIYEPSVGKVITPLRFAYAGDDQNDTLKIDPATLFPPGPTMHERLAASGVPSFAAQPSSIVSSAYSSISLRGVERRRYEDLRDGVASAVEWLSQRDRGFAYVYTGEIDRVGHKHGPSSERFGATVTRTLDAVTAGLSGARDILVLMTADHGQVDVNPFGTIWLDELHPPLTKMPLRPAGSARDVFLHVDDPDSVIEALAQHIEVHRTTDLIADGAFGDVGPRFLERVGNVCVLPPANRMAWLKSVRDDIPYRGHHGGRTDEETATYVAARQL